MVSLSKFYETRKENEDVSASRALPSSLTFGPSDPTNKKTYVVVTVEKPSTIVIPQHVLPPLIYGNKDERRKKGLYDYSISSIGDQNKRSQDKDPTQEGS